MVNQVQQLELNLRVGNLNKTRECSENSVIAPISGGDILRRHPCNLHVYYGKYKYLQLKYAVSTPQKISICLIKQEP